MLKKDIAQSKRTVQIIIDFFFSKNIIGKKKKQMTTKTTS